VRGSELADKLDALRDILRKAGPLLVAYSGGVDSTFLLRVAVDTLGKRVAALTVHSPTAAPGQLADAMRIAEQLGVEHIVIHSDELELPAYRKNSSDRCFYCKSNLFAICAAEAQRRGIATIADGANLDDFGDYRPGLRAAAEHSIRHPLAEVGLSKTEIRALSRALGLPTWDKPASPCLSSRFPYGTAITHGRLAQVGAAESVLKRLGFPVCRVRYHREVARIEVPLPDLPRLLAEGTRQDIVKSLRAIGFRYVAVDLQGFRSGSLNEGLPPSASTRPPKPSPPVS